MSMKKIAFLLFVVALLPQFGYGQGMIFDPVEFSKLPQAPTTDGSKSLGVLPFKLDMTENVPTVITQGKTNQTCVAISTAVYAIGTQRAAALNNTNPQQILVDYALSPIYFFAREKNNDCSVAVRLDEVAKFLRDRGSVPFQTLNAVNCNDGRISTVLKSPVELIKIKEVHWVFQKEKSTEADIKYGVKKQISEKRPVVVGINLDENFKKVSRDNPFYVPTGNPLSEIGHAVTVIGYDDSKQAFKLVNSQGTEWGDNGFFWMRYTDFAAHAHGGFVMHLFPEPLNNGKPAPARLGGTFDFKSIKSTPSGLTFINETPKHILGGMYELTKKDWKVGQQFQLYAENTQQSEHICVFSINNKNQINIHWPRDIKYNEMTYGLGESDLVGQSAKIVIPGTESALVIEDTGTDHLCILYGNNPIKSELQSILQRIQSSSGNILTRVQSALGSRLVKTGVEYAPAKMEFKASPQQGDIVPIILEVKSK